MNRAKRGYVRAGYGNYGNVDFKAGYLWNITGKDRLKVGGISGWHERKAEALEC